MNYDVKGRQMKGWPFFSLLSMNEFQSQTRDRMKSKWIKRNRTEFVGEKFWYSMDLAWKSSVDSFTLHQLMYKISELRKVFESIKKPSNA